MLVLYSTLLWALSALFAKHFFVDFVIQNQYQLKNKGFYGHPGGLLHSGLHAIGSIPAIVLFRPTITVLALFCVIEFLIHYHLDWSKDQIVRKYGWTSSNRAYWLAFGFDQLLHALTYIAMAGALMTLAVRA